MFFLGHLGIGSKLVSPWSRGLSRRAILLGTILPDLVDKPLYYSLSYLTGRHGAELGLISGTRTFAHTAIFLLALAAIAALKRSRLLAALALGIGTHLLIDNLVDTLSQHSGDGLSALLWPALGGFPVFPFMSALEHASTVLNPVVLGGEIAGAAILFWDWWNIANRREIFWTLRMRRFRIRMKRKRYRYKYLQRTVPEEGR
jgi:hypothetical protein